MAEPKFDAVAEPKFSTRRIGLPDGSEALIISAGYRGTRRIVPPAGEEHAFEVPEWKRRVEVYVSPTGRSVRVWVDGEEVRW